MNETFRQMLLEAEKIRSLYLDGSPHAQKMAELVDYGRTHRLFGSSTLNDSSTEEFLGKAAEEAALLLEIKHGENIGSVTDLSREDKFALIHRALEKSNRLQPSSALHNPEN